MGKKKITKKPKGGSQLVHWLKGHNLEHWDDVPNTPPYTKCSCGETWPG